MKFQFLSGDVNWVEYGGKFVSEKLHNGDWPYWLVLDFVNVADYRDYDYKYAVSVLAVSPEAAGDNLEKALELTGLDEVELNDLTAVEALADYGVYATLHYAEGNNYRKLMTEAKKQADLIHGLFGFFMDAPQNRIGSTGWDCIAGDLLAGMNR